MTYDLVIRGGTIVTASDRFVADLGVRAGRIVAIAESLSHGEQEVDAGGCLVLPGGVDVHTHLDPEPMPDLVRLVGAGKGATSIEVGSPFVVCTDVWKAYERGQWRTALVLRVLRGEAQKEVARRANVTPHELETWRRRFLEAGHQSLGHEALGEGRPGS